MRYRRQITLAFVCLVVAGCRHEEPGGIVRGKVSYKGAPLDKGTVVFHPNGGGGQVAHGAVQKDGTFQLVNQNKTELIPLGEYVAVVFADNGSVAAMNEDPLFQIQPTVPFKFSSVTTSPLKYKVELGKNEFDMNLDKF